MTTVASTTKQITRWATKLGYDIERCHVASGSTYIEASIKCPREDNEYDHVTIRISDHEPNYALRNDSDISVYVGQLHDHFGYPGVTECVEELAKRAEKPMPPRYLAAQRAVASRLKNKEVVRNELAKTEASRQETQTRAAAVEMSTETANRLAEVYTLTGRRRKNRLFRLRRQFQQWPYADLQRAAQMRL